MKTINCYSTVNNLWIVSILQFVFTSTHAQLVATPHHTKHPIPGEFSRISYDGRDSVYFFGGFFNDSKTLLRYSFSNEDIQSWGSLPVPTKYGSIQSDWDGNVFYFGADNDHDKVLRYSPSTNSSSIVAHLPYNIYGYPTIKLDNDTVLILGKGEEGLQILSFDLENAKMTTLGAKLPVSVCYGGAIKFGKDKAYLFPYANGSMWEMDLVTMTTTRVPVSLPDFGTFPSVMTDDTFIFISVMFAVDSNFSDHAGIFQIDPVERTAEFRHVSNWPTNFATNAVYVPKLKSIYGFGGRSENLKNKTHNEEDAEIVMHDDILILDVSSLSKNQSIEREILNSIRNELTLDKAPPIAEANHKLACSTLLQNENSKCTLVGNRTKELDAFCGSSSSENATCFRSTPSDVTHYYEGQGHVNLIITRPLLGDECGFIINAVVDSELNCYLKGIRLNLTFVIGEEESQNSHYWVIVLLVILGIGILIAIGWWIRNNDKKRKERINRAVLWDKDKDCEMI